MNWTAAAVSAAVTISAALAGNLLVPKSALAWFRALHWPRWMVPYPAFVAVGLVYYLVMATVLYRALDRQDAASIVWCVVVVLANEAWNAVFFGLRSTLAGLVGIVVFGVPLAALLAVAHEDRLSLALLAGYAAWVVYDVAWAFALWRRNP